MSYENFLRDDKSQAAVVHRILIMGEAAKRLSEEFRASHPEIEWRQITGMRDRCIHRYNEIKPEAVWEVVSVDAPAIERYLKGIVRPPTN